MCCRFAGRGKACKLLVLDALQQVGARRSPNRMGLKVIGQRVGIDEHRLAGHEVGEGHGSSGGGGKSSSESVAKRSASSALPFQPQRPYVSRTQLVFGAMVICTRSCSFKGNGWAGLSTPFS